MSTTKALLVTLEAKPGKEGEVADFLSGAVPPVPEEPDTVASFAIQIGPATFGIFDAFPDAGGRDAHLNGKVAAALMQQAPDLFSKDPDMKQVDVLADKLPGG